MKNKIDLSPNWQYASMIYVWAVKSNKANSKQWLNATEELMRMGASLAQIVSLKSKKHHERENAEASILEIANEVDLKNSKDSATNS